MEKLSEITVSIETKLTKLMQHLEKVAEENAFLKEELLRQQTQYSNLQQEHTDIKNRFEELKVVNSLLGSEEHKRETKLKINSLVREIDHCISQLTKING
ncbi:MAG TPA: hypothetical protein VKY33_08395 [Flavobacterium sp.]|nr:hypothetical protein [Flavobacterium sp.]